MPQINPFVLFVALLILVTLVTAGFWVLFFRQPKPKPVPLEKEEAKNLVTQWCLTNKIGGWAFYWEQQLEQGWLFEIELVQDSSVIRLEVTKEREVIHLN